MDNDPTITASLMAVALALVKVVESLVTWVFKKMTNGHGKTVVELGPEATRMIRETNDKVGDLYGVVTRTNSDGVPLVYGARAEIHQLASAVESIGESIEDLSDKIEAKKKN